MRVKLGWAGEGGGGARPPLFITFTITSKVAVYASAEWADTLTLFHLMSRYVLYSVVLTIKNYLSRPSTSTEDMMAGGRAGTVQISCLLVLKLPGTVMAAVSATSAQTE